MSTRSVSQFNEALSTASGIGCMVTMVWLSAGRVSGLSSVEPSPFILYMRRNGLSSLLVRVSSLRFFNCGNFLLSSSLSRKAVTCCGYLMMAAHSHRVHCVSHCLLLKSTLVPSRKVYSVPYTQTPRMALLRRKPMRITSILKRMTPDLTRLFSWQQHSLITLTACMHA